MSQLPLSLEADISRRKADTVHPAIAAAAAAAPADDSASFASSSSSARRTRGADVSACSRCSDEERTDNAPDAGPAPTDQAQADHRHQPHPTVERRLTGGSSPPSPSAGDRQTGEDDSQESAATRRPAGHQQQEEEGETTLTTPARRFALHRDAIQSMFDFLSRREFSLLARCSRDFRRAATRMTAHRWAVDWAHSAGLSPLLASPLRRHVTTLRLLRDESSPDIRPSLAHDDLRQIADRLPHVEVFQCMIALEAGMPELRWPAKLRVLELRLIVTSEDQPPPPMEQHNGDDDQSRSAPMHRVGESLRRCAPAVEEFTIDCLEHEEGWSRPIPEELLSPLVDWPLLRRITFRGPMSPSACAIVRRMAHLTSLKVDGMHQLSALLTLDGPVPPHLEDVQIDSGRLWLSAEVAPLLLKLKSLRRLQAYFCSDPMILLPILRQLTSLDVNRQSSCDLDLFVSALQQCTQLTRLHVIDSGLSASHLASILPATRHLQSLAVMSANVRSLEFLSQAPLELLYLACCPLEPTDLVAHLRPLRALETLLLDECFTSDLDSATIAALTPGGEGFLAGTWPRLHTFHWTLIPSL